ncbi:MAG: hypothetical protein ACOC0G_02800, partial [Thermodesulfobacteriota bacterium]
WLKWFPWRFFIRRIARSKGFLDPVALLARLHSFAQPSEVAEPIELLRAGVIFHARGLINSRVIQHNLDWVWPYWIERQFDPHDVAFIPRAFSLTHINLTHRNWTAVGYPDCEELPIVDPRGLLTPLLDGWSLDGWLITEDGRTLLPSRAAEWRQSQNLTPEVCITTETQSPGLQLTSKVWVELEEGLPVCKLRLHAHADNNAWLVLALRPYNPEGISFIHEVNLSEERTAWTIDQTRRIKFSSPAGGHQVSDYSNGDVFIHLRDHHEQTSGSCNLGMVTAAALFPATAGATAEVTATIELASETQVSAHLAPDAWREEQQGLCKLSCPEPRYQFLYDTAITSLILHSPDDVYPGPFTYKRFWFRDSAFIIHALLCSGLTRRAKRALSHFPERQTVRGYFRSQDGEWDSNGQVLWILQRYFELTGDSPDLAWHKPIQRGASWIMHKRLADIQECPHAGLLPAGFSAEHLGPNDYYYWDDFWGITGLRAAAAMFKELDPKHSSEFAKDADAFAAAVDRSLDGRARQLKRPAMPASPYRRLDAGAIGSLAFGYPTQLCSATDPRLLDCVEFLYERCFVNGAFYQDMIHSGLNAYLTLHVAQVMLRAGDARYLELMDTVAALATSTGQWPEAIHPHTGGGCMGDGHHVWAAAEWVLMVRNCFVREEGEQLILGAGVPERWLAHDEPIYFGPAPTTFGPVTLSITPDGDNPPRIEWRGDWHGNTPPIEIRLPGFEIISAATGSGSIVLSRKES